MWCWRKSLQKRDAFVCVFVCFINAFAAAGLPCITVNFSIYYTFVRRAFDAVVRATEEVTAKLLQSAYHQIERDGILATRLCTHKDDVELTNDNKLQQLPGEESSVCFVWTLGGVWPGSQWKPAAQSNRGWHIFRPQMAGACFQTPAITCTGQLWFMWLW